MEVIVHCAFDEMVDVEKLVPNPDNNNRHSVEQIERLAKIIEFNGWTSPITVSKRTGFMSRGHARLDAALLKKWKQVPVQYIDYRDEAHEYSDLTADNEIARWAQLDRQAVHEKLELLELDVELLGIEDFKNIDPLEVELPDLGDGSDPDIQQVTFTLSNEQKDILDEAMERAKTELDCSDEINQNSNGNKLSAIMRKYVNS